MNYWRQKSLLRLVDHSREHIIELLNLAIDLKAARRAGTEVAQLRGKKIALIFEKTSTRTRCAFESACFDQGANPSYLGPGRTQLGEKESVADTAKVLGRFYDAIEYRGFAQETVETLAAHAGVPVYNGLTDAYHPTQMLADLLTMHEHCDKPLREVRFAYVGDARNNMGHSLLLAGALMGMDVRIAAPHGLQPDEAMRKQAEALAEESGARLCITDDVLLAVQDCDFIHTDTWLSMGEAQSVWDERVKLLLPYRVTAELMVLCANRNVKFMHCLPAWHDCATPVGQRFFAEHGLTGVEVANEVFSGSHSVVFDQAENRMHTIKALLVATLADPVADAASVQQRLI